MNLKPELAIIKKEILEHKGGLFYAPAILSILFFVLVSLAGLLEPSSTDPDDSHKLFIFAFGAGAVFYIMYTVITLFFYYADAFCSDRKNNGLLFWKSLPISDLKILSLKFFTGTFIFPIIMLGWIIVGAILAYFVGLINFVHFESILMPWTAIATLLNLSVHFIVIFIVGSLWYAPFYAWVALLSVFFKKWSIALAFVIPVVLIIIEQIFNFDGFESSMLADFLGNRLTEMFVEHSAHENVKNYDFDFDKDGFDKYTEFSKTLTAKTFEMLMNVRWTSLVGGLVVSGVFIYVSAEYRKRFIEG